MGYESDIENEYIILMMGDEANNPTFLEDARIEVCRSFWPRRCYNTKRSLWFKISVRGRRIYRVGDTNFAYEDRWFDAKEFTSMKLRGHA